MKSIPIRGKALYKTGQIHPQMSSLIHGMGKYSALTILQNQVIKFTSNRKTWNWLIRFVLANLILDKYIYYYEYNF